MAKSNKGKVFLTILLIVYLIGLVMLTLLPDMINITYETTYNLTPITSIDNSTTHRLQRLYRLG